jgi:hypothetical protein
METESIESRTQVVTTEPGFESLSCSASLVPYAICASLETASDGG